MGIPPVKEFFRYCRDVDSKPEKGCAPGPSQGRFDFYFLAGRFKFDRMREFETLTF